MKEKKYNTRSTLRKSAALLVLAGSCSFSSGCGSILREMMSTIPGTRPYRNNQAVGRQDIARPTYARPYNDVNDLFSGLSAVERKYK